MRNNKDQNKDIAFKLEKMGIIDRVVEGRIDRTKRYGLREKKI